MSGRHRRDDSDCHGLAAWALLRQLLAEIPHEKRRRLVRTAILELEATAGGLPSNTQTHAARRLLVGLLARKDLEGPWS